MPTNRHCVFTLRANPAYPLGAHSRLLGRNPAPLTPFCVLCTCARTRYCFNAYVQCSIKPVPCLHGLSAVVTNTSSTHTCTCTARLAPAYCVSHTRPAAAAARRLLATYNNVSWGRLLFPPLPASRPRASNHSHAPRPSPPSHFPPRPSFPPAAPCAVGAYLIYYCAIATPPS